MRFFGRHPERAYSGEILDPTPQYPYIVTLKGARYFGDNNGDRHVLLPEAGNNIVADPRTGQVGLGLPQHVCAEVAAAYGRPSPRPRVSSGESKPHYLGAVVGGTVFGLLASMGINYFVNGNKPLIPGNVQSPPAAGAPGANPTHLPTAEAAPSADPSEPAGQESPAPSPAETPTPAPVRDLTEYTVVLDPGHSGGKTTVTEDPETKLWDQRYSNEPEMTDVYNISKQVEAGLEARGVKVFMTKNGPNAKMNNRQRADFAMKHKADLAASIHYDASQKESDFSVVWDQRLRQYRQNVDKKTKKPIGPKVMFENPTIACLSKGDAAVMADVRTDVQGVKTIVTKTSFDSRGYPKPKGNIPLVMLFQGAGHNSGLEDNNAPEGVPWIYNEVGAKGFTAEDMDRYGNAILKGLVKALETQKQIKEKCGIFG